MPALRRAAVGNIAALSVMATVAVVAALIGVRADHGTAAAILVLARAVHSLLPH